MLIDLRVLFKDNPKQLAKVIKFENQIEEANQRLGNAINKITFEKLELSKQVASRIDILKIVDEGKIKTINSPEYLKNEFGGDSITINVNPEFVDNIIKILKDVKEISEVKKFDDKITLFVSNAKILLPKIFKIIYDKKFKINSISSSECTLDDVFLSYTGKNLREEERSSQLPKNSKRGFRR